MYRYRRLDEARAAAKDVGSRGAMYPWQSGSDGKEETQVVHLNPRSGRWDRDLSHNQRHVSAAIFYNIWRYYQATEDYEFLLGYGAEMMLEIARFWSSIAKFNPDRGRYEIHGVMGPDEFHEKYPDSEEEGLSNNAYTNVMVAWICETAQEVVERLPERARRSLGAKIGLSENEVEMWKDMSHRMFVPFHDNGIISQFEGYEKLEELDWEFYRAKYGNIQRLDRILRAEGDTPDRYKLSKQADALMLFFMFAEEELRRLFKQLGYKYSPSTARKNIAYYEPRTTHGSTLSFVVHAAILADLDPKRSWDMFTTALESDVGDIQGGTTKEGIHMGVMAGALDLIQRGYMGAEIQDGVLCFSPKPNERLDGLSLPLRFRKTQLEIALEGKSLMVAAPTDGLGRTIEVRVGDESREIKDGEHYVFPL
jgi:alpha,alpha-trehalase